MEYACLGVLVTLIYFWLPYYCYEIGLKIASYTFSICTALGVCLSCLIFIPLTGNLTDRKPIITSLLLFFNIGLATSLLFNNGNQESVPIYLVQSFLMSLALNVPYFFTISSELNEKVQTGREKYLILNFMRVVEEVLSILMQIFTSVLFQTSK